MASVKRCVLLYFCIELLRATNCELAAILLKTVRDSLERFGPLDVLVYQLF